MKKLAHILLFPVLFLYFIGKILAAAIGLKNNNAFPAVFAGVVLTGVGLFIWAMFRPPNPLGDIEAPAGEDGGVYFIPSDDTNTVMSVTMLESALSQYHIRHGKLPENFAALQASGIIRNLREPRPGYRFELDLEWPQIIEVPVNAAPLKRTAADAPQDGRDRK